MIVNHPIFFEAQAEQEGDSDQQATEKKDEGKPECRAGQKIINDVPIHIVYLMCRNFTHA
jgi:hypothetical protein